ncbi:MAG: hypothetical protein LBV11_09465 [Bacillus cereus]|jgi:hypothetical protein|nr:hypothetical protein [Bacillus cereus]
MEKFIEKVWKKIQSHNIIASAICALIIVFIGIPLLFAKRDWLWSSESITELQLILYCALITFIFAQLFLFIVKQNKHNEKMEIHHQVLETFLSTYNNIHNKDVVDKMLASFQSFCKIFSSVDEKQRKIVEHIFTLKYGFLLKQCFRTSDEKEMVVFDIPGYYFEDQEDTTIESIWEILISNISIYESFQLLTKDMAELYNTNRLKREIAFLTSQIENKNNPIKIFKKIIVVDDDDYEDCDIIKKEGEKVNAKHKINKECYIKCSKVNMCSNKKVINQIYCWKKFEKEMKDKKYDVTIKCIFKAGVEGYFDGSKLRDFGVFDDNILGIQRNIKSLESPFKDMLCDFYFGDKDVKDYKNKFEQILNDIEKYKCN